MMLNDVTKDVVFDDVVSELDNNFIINTLKELRRDAETQLLSIQTDTGIVPQQVVGVKPSLRGGALEGLLGQGPWLWGIRAHHNQHTGGGEEEGHAHAFS